MTELPQLRLDEWDTSAALNDLCAVAARLVGAPMAHISLVDRDGQIFAGKIGLDPDRTPGAIAICAHTIMTPEPFLVGDASSDPRFSENPLVTEHPNIRAYLGIPLEIAPGLRIGALYAADSKPRVFTDSEVQTLTKLARVAVWIIRSYCTMLHADRQLTGAIALQEKMLPSKARIEQIEAACPVELASCYRACDGIGGDIWGIEATGPQRLLLYVADFTGHGLAAALNTARFHSFVHLNSQRTDKPASMLRQLNRQLNEVLPVGQFATMFCATIDFRAKSLEYASAGAPPQLYRWSSAASFELLAKPGLPLGVMPNAVFESETVPFERGGVLVLYTDGLIETPRPPDAIFTPGALRRLLDAFPGDGAAELASRITSTFFFDPTIQQDDDLTLIVAKCTGEGMEPPLDCEV